MLARNLVIRHGKQPILVKPAKINDGYRIISGSIFILYTVKFAWEENIFRDRDAHIPYLVGAKADDFSVNDTGYESTETPFVAWAAPRAREIVDA
jgi:hypothetical protein